jgi:hypothetical protein
VRKHSLGVRTVVTIERFLIDLHKYLHYVAAPPAEKLCIPHSKVKTPLHHLKHCEFLYELNT